ncbi:MAG TPA: hypothetical protein VJC03_09530 [bacterium]|nr:hypothetical protein [bacterium]
MRQISELISGFLGEYGRRREELGRFLAELEIKQLVNRFDIKENRVNLYCRSPFERHLLLFKKESLFAAFRKKFGILHLAILLEGKNEL